MRDLDFERCWRATLSRDTRFDGVFYSAVRTTGVYCRPSCPGCPKRENVCFYGSSAAAQGAGYRACKRCNPDASPGSPEWDVRADVVGRAMRLIGDGVVDRDGVSGLAERLGYTARHLHRQLVAEIGVGPQGLARARRAQTARVLLETTGLRVTDVATAAGFSSLRQFNDTMRTVFGTSPTALRRGSGGSADTTGAVTVRLSVREPFDGPGLLRFFAAHAVPGVEEVIEAGALSTYRRSLSLPRGAGTVALTPVGDHVRAEFRLQDIRDLAAAIHRCRRLLDLDADPVAVSELLARDEVIAPLVRGNPGLRVPGRADGPELMVRALLGPRSPATTAALARLVRHCGTPLRSPTGGVTHLFPSPETLAEADLAALLPPRRASAIRAAATGLASGALVLGDGADRAEAERQLLRLPGIGCRAAGYVALHGLRDPDVFLAGDRTARAALTRLGRAVDAAGAARLAERWRPWRSYALVHLWSSVETAGADG
ncbi:AlkA N-terminal domain-containing protein [Streptomyces sp. NPDC050617]|uniref:DNA-3-methyladenine glycosylase 2 family protein n=1 Tax=Streptomyces sp. NPDC050617 TaxID=3154628 RepID=UPI00342EBDFF